MSKIKLEILAVFVVVTVVYAYNEWRDYKTDNKIITGAITDIKEYSDGTTSLLLYKKEGEWNKVRTEYSHERIYKALGDAGNQ